MKLFTTMRDRGEGDKEMYIGLSHVYASIVQMSNEVGDLKAEMAAVRRYVHVAGDVQW
jgi:hypothetical protein